MKTVAHYLAAMLSLLLLAGCGSDSQVRYTARNVTGVVAPLQFTLTDEDARPLAARDLRDKIVLMYFGYTHCPDVCPATLARVTHAFKDLGADAGRMRMLFVSVDPKRDRPSVLKAYTDAFSPLIVGATGTSTQLTDMARRYRVAYRLGKPDANGDYAVYHSSAIFVFDGRGQARLLITGTETAPEIAADLEKLLANP